MRIPATRGLSPRPLQTPEARGKVGTAVTGKIQRIANEPKKGS